METPTTSTTTYDYRLHLGPHSPLSVPMQKLLSLNSKRLTEVGAEYPAAKTHREVLSEVLKLPDVTLVEKETHQLYVDSVLQHDESRRIIYNYDAFLGSRRNAMKRRGAYISLEKKIEPLRWLTLAHKVTVFVCLQSFARFVEFELANTPDARDHLASNPDSLKFSWVPFVMRLRNAWPEARIVILRADELAPQWAAMVALVTGHSKAHSFKNIGKFPLSCLAEGGRKRFIEEFKADPPRSVVDWSSKVARIFSTYGFHEPVLKKIIAGPWTSEQIQYSEAVFESDLVQLRQLENVTLASDAMPVLQ